MALAFLTLSDILNSGVSRIKALERVVIMKCKFRVHLFVAIGLPGGFVAWTVLVCFVDVQPIGPYGSAVGFAMMNGAFHRLTGVNMLLYTVTDWLGLVPIVTCLGFAILGLVQWIRRKRILSVDQSILALGGFYTAVIAVYLIFELVTVNYRPVLIDVCLEASYPSSTTMLVMSVMPTAIMQARERIKNAAIRRMSVTVVAAFIAFMVIGRLLSGVHWLSDVIGGALISASLVEAYRFGAKE